MPLENVGKIIKINIKKKQIDIYFDVFPPLSILEETYTNYYLFVDKKISEDEYNKIIQDNQTSILLKMMLNSLARKMYTEKEIKQKLYLKKANDRSIKYIIEYLKNHRLIDDKKYAIEYKEVMEQKYTSKKAIIYHLKAKGILQSIIDTLEFTEENEEIKGRNKLNNLKQKYKNNASIKKYQLIKNSLYNDGFESEIIDKLMKEVKDNSLEDEKNNLRKELLRFINANYDEQKIMQRLKLKGYKYDLIKEVMEEVK